jgi:ATP-dependent Clp protease ATP-binding subunit ClpC
MLFRQLERSDLVKMVDLELAKVIQWVRAKDIKVHFDTTALEFLIDKGYDPTYGALPMRRAVEKYLEDPLAKEFLQRRLHDLSEVNLDARLRIVIHAPTSPQIGSEARSGFDS